MASNNTATTGATQNNIGLDIAVSKSVHYHISTQTTTVAAAQQFGSPLDTRYSYNPLQELIQATNNADILAKRYYGDNIYEQEKGWIRTQWGDIKEIVMGDITKQDGERPTQLSTIIVCLSVHLGKRWLSQILASAIMLYTHGQMDKSMEGVMRVFQGKIDKYANSVLSRDGMCNKLENVKVKIRRLIRENAPHIRDHTLFLPPRTSAEESDFVEFIVELWSAQADGEKIYTRSVKLLALALLLSEYGWQIDILVENDDLEMVHVKTDTGALSVIYSSTTTTTDKDRKYVENHNRYSKMSTGFHIFYPTACCLAAHMGEVTGRSFSRTEDDQKHFMYGYKAVNTFCEKHVDLQVKVGPSGHIRLIFEYRTSISPRLYREGLEIVLNRCGPLNTTFEFKNFVATVLYGVFPNYDWRDLDDELKKQPYPEAPFATMLSYSEGKNEKLWSLTGAITCTLDKIIESLVHIPSDSLFRIPVGQSLSSYISGSVTLLENLLNPDSSKGLEPGCAVQLCAIRLAGLESGRPMAQFSPNDIIIGYWNAQQGILLTPILERTLLFDLPIEKFRPLTFFNTPIMGMPTDEGGWIKAGTAESAHMRDKRNYSLKSARHSDIITEYRPNFESDSTTVVAAVYIDGIFYNLLRLNDTISASWYTVSQCQCSQTMSLEAELKAASNAFMQPFESFEPGEISVPTEDGLVVVVGPQINEASRFFSSLAYKDMKPVIQEGCLSCALRRAGETYSSVVIPRLEPRKWDVGPYNRRKAI
ncbi:hypothetical protein F4813DRAFT_360498 [Daldinia decipiens]|uniref:uncharacterized protein n=1 Tax=Daldinia decipiens TaxID=326647 RepID=UPI0020C4C037|nr:uncharacterized protein F4813DRAFT_360498 [Daldinia decipiens]KAI1657174.1 hypothetical protein F4813DRAFT_360498 [Daldinia decipiens]